MIETDALTIPGVRRTEPGAFSTAVRLGGLFGPSVFGVTAAGVALPEIAADLHAGPAAVAWVLTAHALALGVGTAVFGRLADTWGVRAGLLAGALVLAAGAVVCVAAPGLGVLVAGRLVLAAGSGAMAAGGVALLAATDPERRRPVMAGYGAVLAVFAAGATLVGGAATTWLSWRVTVVLPVLSLLAVPFCLRLVTRPGSGRAMDVPGAALLTAAASALLVLIQARTLSLPGGVTAAVAAVLALSGGGLVLRVARRPQGFVSRSVVADARFRIAAVIGVGVYGGLFATMYAVPQILARSYDWSVLTVGAALLPGAAVGAGLSRAAGSLNARSGRALLAATAAAAAVALGVAGTVGSGRWGLVAAASLGLAAFALAQVVVTAEMSARLPLPLRGAGMGLLNLTFFVGGGAGSAACAALADSMGLSDALLVVAAFPLVAGVVAVASMPRERRGGESRVFGAGLATRSAE